MRMLSPTVQLPAQRPFFSEVNPRPRALTPAALALALCGSAALAFAGPAATTTTLAVTSGGSAVNSVAPGSVVTLTAAVTAGGKAVTQGQVNFCEAQAAQCTDIHLLGTAQLTRAGLATIRLRPGVGRRYFKAVFAGTRTDAGSASDAATLTASGSGLSTTAIAQSGAAGNHTLPASVAGAAKSPPSGRVSFLDTSNGNAVLGTATVSVTPAVNPATYGSPITLTAHITGSGTAPTGTVSFYDGNGLLGTSTLEGGEATFGWTTPIVDWPRPNGAAQSPGGRESDAAPESAITGDAASPPATGYWSNVERYDVFGDSISAGCCTVDHNTEAFPDLLARDWGLIRNVNYLRHGVSSTTVADGASLIFATTRTAGINQVATIQFGINDLNWTNAELDNSAFGPTEQSAIMAEVLWLATPLAQPKSAGGMQPANTVCTGQAGWAASTLHDPFIPDRDFNNGFAETFQMAGSTAGKGCWATVEGSVISIGYTATAATSGTAQVIVDGQPAAVLTSQPYYTPLPPGAVISSCDTVQNIETCTFNSAAGAPYTGSLRQIVIQGASDAGTNGAFWPCTGVDTPAAGCTEGPTDTRVQFYNSLAAANSTGGQIGNNLTAFSDTLFSRTFIPQVLQITAIDGTPLSSGSHKVGVVPINGGPGNNIYLDYFTGNGGINPYIGPTVALLGVERILNRSSPDWMTAIWDQLDRNVAGILDGEGYPVSYADIRDAQGAYPGGPIERYMWPENQINCTATRGSPTLSNCSIVAATSTMPSVTSLMTSAYVDDLGATLPFGSTILSLTNNSITISPYVAGVTFTPGSGQTTAGCDSEGLCTVESSGGGCIVPAVVDFQIVGGAIESATVEPGNQGGFCSGAPTFTVSQGGVPGTITPVMSTGAIASGPTTVQVYFPGAHPCQGQSYCLGGHVELENAVLNSLTASALRVGNFSITATYSGDSSYRPATSAALNLTVKRATPSVTVKYPYNSSALGSTITFTATVTGATLPPTGTVAFTDGANPLGSSVLSGGEATFSTNSLGLGAHFIAVSYSGDHDYAGATSAPVQVTVTQKTTPAISLSASSSSVEFGQPVTLTAAVTGSGPLPTGSVSFTSGKTVLGTAELDGTGNARYSTDELPPGGDAIIATYAGDSEYLSATSPTVIVRVFQRSLARPPVSRAVLEPSRE